MEVSNIQMGGGARQEDDDQSLHETRIPLDKIQILDQKMPEQKILNFW